VAVFYKYPFLCYLRGLFLLLFLTHGISSHLYAQEEIGYTASNYSGAQGLFLNPAKGCDSKLFLDINLVGLDLFVHNNFVFYDRENFFLWKNIKTGFPDLTFNEKASAKRAQVLLNITGPSIHLSVGKHSFGLITRARSYTSAKIELPMAIHIIEGFKYGPQLAKRYNLENNFVNSLTWLEYGLHYGYIFSQSKRTQISAAATIRYLTGINTIGVDAKTLNYEVRDSLLLEFYKFSGSIQQAIPSFGAGSGIGFDIGAEYKQMLGDVSRYYPNSKRSGCKKMDYKWKAGASLLDLGLLRFKKDASKQEFIDVSSSWFKYDSTGVTAYEGVDSLIQERFNPQGKVKASKAFSTWLPLAASFQFDYNFENYFYVNGTATFGPRIGNSVRRGSLLAVVPRYERRRFELSVPLSLWDFRYPQLGFQVRLNNNVIIGSDRAMPFLFRSNVYGTDIYFHLKLALHKNPACNKKGKGKGKSKNGGKKAGYTKRLNDCPAYR
jgi:hypothetical protein